MTPDPAGDALQRGREAAADGRWAEAFDALAAADAGATLDAGDLEQLGMAARLVGREEVAIRALERAHEALRGTGQIPRAARVAFWLTLFLVERGDVARGSGWLASAQRLLDGYGDDCVERGYLLVPRALQALRSGDPTAAQAGFEDALECGERFGDLDLAMLGRLGTGQSLVQLGARDAGTAMLDEVMVAVTAGSVSPVVAGIGYCSVIETCHALFDVRRAQEWTDALSAWCEAHPDIVAFRGQCLTYRSEIMRLHGAWSDALHEAQRAADLLSQPPGNAAVGAATYEQAELHRLRGQFREAEEAYREASRWGRHPEPGLALLRLAEGRTAAAAASIRRALDEAEDPATRCRLLPAFVEIMVVAGDLDAARSACQELAILSEQFDIGLVRAVSLQARGLVALEEGDAQRALVHLRQAWSEWRRLRAPYDEARVRWLLSRACRDLGDDDAADLEVDAARRALEELGALTDLAVLDGGTATGAPRMFTPREFEVLQLLASGKSNRAIAADLVISEKTVARHVSNILAKADVPSRTAAVAFAHDRGIL